MNRGCWIFEGVFFYLVSSFITGIEEVKMWVLFLISIVVLLRNYKEREECNKIEVNCKGVIIKRVE